MTTVLLWVIAAGVAALAVALAAIAVIMLALRGIALAVCDVESGTARGSAETTLREKEGRREDR